MAEPPTNNWRMTVETKLSCADDKVRWVVEKEGLMPGTNFFLLVSSKLKKI